MSQTEPLVGVDPESKVPPYEQVRTEIATKINDGALAVGTKLPTVRSLAAEVGIAANTIARAYRELEEAGLIETKGRSGTFVAATGDRTRIRARDAARRYADTAHKLGLSDDEAIAIVTAAIRSH
ncbi:MULTISPECIES: GntR family transcriptional regulator [Prauserella salsuginis group]|uniref:GntR family transcriptional regulator n=1 Tax=Prauserella salsuginis TaxID=387889 RepID=A0ABW6G6L4_9PSEU|nr:MULTISPECIES: GntR family transcriptional regulator [Prauserella salsuginis group]MCR3722738.1 DNA-binding transcriptional regulator YhcF, GntR family [Prauserella flava]MCR3737207.1 DNA-binding transcriptional regulator YhcF, GntR family [Prauserella salsuginis]